MRSFFCLPFRFHLRRPQKRSTPCPNMPRSLELLKQPLSIEV